MGAVQNLSAGVDASTLTGGTQTITGGPVASQEAIKELGTNGGGFYNANSAHPFENPNPVSNLFEIFLLLLIPVALTRTFGLMVGDRRQGYAILAAMTVLWLAVLGTVWALEVAHPGTALQAAGASMEGKETRFGEPGSALFATSTTGTSTGAVNSFHSSFTAIGGGALILNMGFGEVAPGGAGTGLYGMLVLAIVTVFVAGLMVGRTPEYLRKKITAREIKLVSLSILVMPVVVLVGTGVAMALPGPRESILNAGPHGLSEVLYAFMSAANNNGSAFAGLSANTDFYNTGLGLAMLVGRFLPIMLVLALAGSLARQTPVPATAGTLPTHRAAVRLHARRRHRHRRRSHLLPGARTGTAGGRSVAHDHHLGSPDDAGCYPVGSGAACSTRPWPGTSCPLRSPSSTRASWCTPRSCSSSRSAPSSPPCSPSRDPSVFAWSVVGWLWLTVLFANLAEAVAEGRGKAQAATLRRAKTETVARRLDPRRCRGARCPRPSCGSATASWSRPARSSPATAT